MPIVFVVEDDLEIAHLIAFHLNKAGFDARVFCSSMQVMDEALKTHPAAFLLDIMVPGGSGLELCRQIRRTVLLSDIPVVFVTARISEQDRALGFAAGANDYVTKPFSPQELIHRLESLLVRANGSDPGYDAPRVQ
jgi:two-component system phosphate regulon response regulator PhoB